MKMKFNGQRVFRVGQRIKNVFNCQSDKQKGEEKMRKNEFIHDPPPILMTKRPIEKEIDDWYESHAEKIRVNEEGDNIDVLTESPPCIMAPVMEQK